MKKNIHQEHEIFSNYHEFAWNFVNKGEFLKQKKHIRYLHNGLCSKIYDISKDIILDLQENDTNNWEVHVIIRESLLKNFNKDEFKNNIKEIYSMFFSADQTNYKIQWREWEKSELITGFLSKVTEAKEKKQSLKIK